MTIEETITQAERMCESRFHAIDELAQANQEKVLDAFRHQRIAQRHFAGTTGYGYDDVGRDALGRTFAEIFGAEAALVSPMLASGTHAITAALFGLLRRGDTLLAVTGVPYDTLMPVILGEGIGSLSDYGVSYREAALLPDGLPNYAAIEEALRDQTVKVAFLQRSKGYSWRDAFDIETIGETIRFVKTRRPDVKVIVDNCYGEFTDRREPTEVGADLVVGSMIKNPGGGLAPTGGYLAGTAACVDAAAARCTAPGAGAEVGSYAYGYQSFFQGLFLAPHTVAQALKGSCLAGCLFSNLGYRTLPPADAKPNDIIRSIRFDTQEELIAFCQAIQAASPIDSFVTPEPWEMPGYEHRVIMAAGTFVGGASIELSCDSPIKEPYIAYLQGGLTYEHVKAAMKECMTTMRQKGLLK